jgi:formylglycine-generating enzyme required for sulfatase activity
MFYGLGIFQRLNLSSTSDYANVYLFKRNNFLDKSNQELILVPTDSETDLLATLDRIKEEYSNARNCRVLFIDCFNEYTEDEFGDISIMDPETFWNRLIGTNKYIEELNKKIYSENISQRFIYKGIEQLIEKEGVISNQAHNLNAIEYFEKWSQQPASKANNILLIGERGSGKSWMMKQFAAEQNARHQGNIWVLPPAVYVNLNAYGEYILKAQGIRKSLAYFIHTEYKLQTVGEIYFINAAIQNGQVIILLDGVDEISREFSFDDVVRHYLTITNYLSSESKVIITTRSSRFPSRHVLYNFFAKSKLPENNKFQKNSLYVRSSLSQQYNPVYDIYSLIDFDEGDLLKLTDKNKLSLEKDFDTVSKQIKSIITKNETGDFLAKQLCELANIPTCAQQIIDLTKIGIHNNLHLFELSVLNPLIIYNIETDRAVVKYAMRKMETTLIDSDIDFGELDLLNRLEILEHIAWHLLETVNDYFDPLMIGYSFLNIPVEIFEILVNDMRSQTVFSFHLDTTELKFRLDSLWSYFVSRHIFYRLTDMADENERLNGIMFLGRHNLSINRNKSVGLFLKIFFSEGMVKAWNIKDEYFDEINYLKPSKEYVTYLNKDQLKRDLTKVNDIEPDFSPWTQYLTNNLKIIDESFEIPKTYKKNDKWGKSVTISEEEGVLIIDQEQDLSFNISRKEVTNSEFKQFLEIENNWIPELVPVNENVNYPLKVSFKKSEPGVIHPLSWNAIHKGTKERYNNKFRWFTNDYHLFKWISGKYDNEISDHPVVWVSAYVVAIYCNWKTLINFISKHKIESMKDFTKIENKIHFYYDVTLENEDVPKLKISGKNECLGFRMPSEKEWAYAARARDNNEFPWEQFTKSKNKKEQEKGKLLKRYLTEEQPETKSVMSSLPNSLSIYGMIGNVREWIYNVEKKQEGKIMGATGALGENTFAYDFKGSNLPLRNTNLDVGFRWARSFSEVSEKQKSKL